MIKLRRCKIKQPMHEGNGCPCDGVVLEDIWFRRKYRIILGCILIIIGWAMILS